jgi:hypothetical protein
MRTKFFQHSDKGTWLTPGSYFVAIDRKFDHDVAHPGWSNPYCSVPTREIYTKDDDGLRQQWTGFVWMNPPFNGRHSQIPWLKKFFAHGNGIALVNALTSSGWFHELVVPHAETLLFPKGKTKFILPEDGSVATEPPNGIVLIGMGELANTALSRCGLGWFVSNRRLGAR